MPVRPRGGASASITAKAVAQTQDEAFEPYDEPAAEATPATQPVGVPASTAPADGQPQSQQAAAPVTANDRTAPAAAQVAAAPAVEKQSAQAAGPEPTVARAAEPEPAAASLVHPREPVDALDEDDEDDDESDDVADPQAYEIPARLFNKLKAEAKTGAWQRRARSPQTEIVRLALEEAAELMTTLVRHEGQTVVHSPVFGTRVVSAPKTRGATERLQVRMTYGETKALRKWADSLDVDTVSLVRCALHNRYPEVKRTRKPSSKTAVDAKVEATSDAA